METGGTEKLSIFYVHTSPCQGVEIKKQDQTKKKPNKPKIPEQNKPPHDSLRVEHLFICFTCFFKVLFFLKLAIGL